MKLSALNFGIVAAILLATSALRAAEWGDLTGQFVLKGETPKPAALVVPPGAGCGAVKLVDESLTIGPAGGIKNIVVYLYLASDELPPEPHPQYAAAAKAQVLLDNKGCRFEPRFVLVRTGQTLVVGNKDAIPHSSNLNFLVNTPSALIVPAQGKIDVDLPKREFLPATVSCAIHPWMSAWAVVRDSPYMALTDESGTFTIKDIPAGKWTFQFWHERCGFLAKELTQKDKPITWTKGRTPVTIAKQVVDLGTINVGVAAFIRK